MRIILLLLSAGLIFCQEYDLLLKGGHVIDPKNKISARRDVAIKDGRIAAVAAEIPATKAAKTINVAGLYVTPGLVDLHVHVYAGTGTAYTGPSSVRPDDHSFRSGVTTVVDAGSSGWRNFEDFKKLIIDRAGTRVLAMLNIVGAGMAGAAEQNLQDMDPGKAAEMAAKHRQIIVGIKTAHYAGPEWIPVENAVKAGDIAGVPVMVDFGSFRPERPFEDLVTKKLRPGGCRGATARKRRFWVCRREWSAYAGNAKVGMRIDRERRESCMGPQWDDEKRLEVVRPLRSPRRPAVGRDCPVREQDQEVAG